MANRFLRPQSEILAKFLAKFFSKIFDFSLIPSESSDWEESFKHVFAGWVSSVSSSFSKIAKQLPGWDRKWSYKKSVYYSLVAEYLFFKVIGRKILSLVKWTAQRYLNPSVGRWKVKTTFFRLPPKKRRVFALFWLCVDFPFLARSDKSFI